MARTPPGRTRQKVWEFVRERLLQGRPPTVREVQRAMGFSAVQTARQHLEALVAEGRLVAERGRARGYRLPNGLGGGTTWAPLLGRVQAGALTTAVEDLEGYVPVQARGSAGDLFALRVRGESMTGAGIFPGDLVIVRKQPSARSGEIVVALVDDEATVKRLRFRGRRAELHPENPAFSVLSPPAEELVILGKVIEVRRRLEGDFTVADEAALPTSTG